MEAASDNQHDERLEIIKCFDETKAGVKGLADSGLQKLPKFFVRPSDELAQELGQNKFTDHVQPPVIDLTGFAESTEKRKQIVQQVTTAAATWGFFQVVNHGIPQSVLDGMIEGVRNFHEMDTNEKKKYYTRDYSNKVIYNCNYDLYSSRTAGWKDTLIVKFTDDHKDGQDLPVSCRYHKDVFFFFFFSVSFSLSICADQSTD